MSDAKTELLLAWSNAEGLALRKADTLIAAAREGK